MVLLTDSLNFTLEHLVSSSPDFLNLLAPLLLDFPLTLPGP
jgi:hypothetical protein